MQSLELSTKRVGEAIRAKDLCKVYPNGTQALKNVSLSIRENDFAVIIGLSGAGKSTLLRCLNRLIRPSSGRLSLFGEDITLVNGRKLKQVRRRVGMIFQQFNLVTRLTVLENVLVGRLRFNASPARRCGSLFRQFSRAEKEFAF
ncbi:MAG: ATP-binding cassette domain-containing protein, partial [Proteobacteria bacterium]|nr:ATP-binding cassette domain-containing protein [Pseudomonadota bacterium]